VFRLIQEKLLCPNRRAGWVAGLIAACAAIEILILALSYTPAWRVEERLCISPAVLERFRYGSAFLLWCASWPIPGWCWALPAVLYRHSFAPARLLADRTDGQSVFGSLGAFPGFAGNWGKYLATSVLLIAFCAKIATFFPEVSTYPFSLGWSEASRYYYASLFLSKQIYGIDTPPSVLHRAATCCRLFPT